MPAALADNPKSKNNGKAKAKPAGPAVPLLAPMAGETQSQFYLRASRALRQRIPSVNRRTIEILRIWRRSANDKDLRDKAEAMFPASQFVRFGPRCIFLEHTVPASEDGSRPEIVYGQKQLQQLVDWANYRIRNTENFSAISDGHTPSQAERAAGSPMPNALGYAGPFYLGQLGDVDPLWAIYADEWVHKDDVARFAKLQRRSPEVWANEPMEQRTLDPIAALGAETPRLDCGMNPYTRAGDGQTVMRYSAATLPGAFNIFIPSAGRNKHRYSGESDMPLGNDTDTTQPDLEAAIGSALQAILPNIVQAVVAQIQGGDGEQPPPEDDEPGDDAEPGATPRGMESPGDEPAADSAPAEDDPEARKYKAQGPQCYEAYMAGRRGATRYSRSSAADSGLSRVVARQADRIKALETSIAAERRDVLRYQRLDELSREYEFDPRDELVTCADMSDQQFERHCTATVVKYSRRGDVTGVDLYEDEPERYSRGGARVDPQQIERYSREAAAVAARKNAEKRGSTTFEAEFDAICKQHGITV